MPSSVTEGSKSKGSTGRTRQDIRKPAYRPPNWAFPVVWTSLYTCMGYASYMVYRDGAALKDRLARPWPSTAAKCWSIGHSRPSSLHGKTGFVNTVVLWGGVAVTMKSFYDINPTAGALLVPYQIWVTLAATLAYNIWQLNPDHEKKDA
ncbi:hypothetical protein TCAL_15877 [Tigriopus californicus]|uniref:Peripheral-type benzodiazepine receptor n=1 Tax=Tigriopus californicus TaxID=6832 RepID=A0A553NQZ8_TIGCA|nr:hypothetical protein TCAL_15877 [Tigriopus californicus]